MGNQNDESETSWPLFVSYSFASLKCSFLILSTDKLEPIILDCQMAIICAQWNHDGSILAIGGVQIIDDKEINLVQFYSPSGEVIFIGRR